MSRTEADFVAAGVAIVKERGFAELHSRALGEAMGVHSTAIYRHYPQWDLLVLAVTDALLGELAAVRLPAIMSSENPRARLLALMQLVRSEIDDNPDLASNLVRMAGIPVSVGTPNADALATLVVDALRDMGVPSAAIPAAYQALENFTIGGAAVDYAGLPDHLAKRLGRRRMAGIPELTESARSVTDIERLNSEAFMFGANAILDACAALSANA